MRYVLTIIGEEGGWEDATPEDMRAVLNAWNDYTESLTNAGAFIAGEGLQESAAATTVRGFEGDERLVTDGPFAETKEQLGGFYLIEVANLDEALEWAKKMPARGGAVEVRPVMDYDAFAAGDPSAAAEVSS
jgi:hypothetical protein